LSQPIVVRIFPIRFYARFAEAELAANHAVGGGVGYALQKEKIAPSQTGERTQVGGDGHFLSPQHIRERYVLECPKFAPQSD